MNITKELVLEALKNVEDPDLKQDIVTLGMVRDLIVDGKDVRFTVMLTTPACPMKELIHKAAVNAVLHYVDKEAKVDVKMDADVTSRKKDKTSLPNVKNIIAIASGKGGVGKSTVAANLAVALVRQGAKVGLLDADIYGPSIPTMFDVIHEHPPVKNIAGISKMIPIESYGVKLNSIGFMAAPDQAVPWRGPMATKALNELIQKTDWGELDYLIIDLPPGTGDIHLSIVSNVSITGAIIVSTPQQVALSDVQRGISMFRLPAVNVPVLGIVENMAWFTPAELPDHRYFIFGKEGVQHLAAKTGLPVLGQIPLIQSICESGDAGRPVVLQEGTSQSVAFVNLAKAIAQQIAIKNNTVAPETAMINEI
jgi:ATP-binding protein involved in chromosome partitioning